MVIQTMAIGRDLNHFLAQHTFDALFVLVDSHTRKLCWPLLRSDGLTDEQLIEIPAGDEQKNLQTLESVWLALNERGATRHSLLINLGGGMVTDLGGFAAATFKRGCVCINVPTTLLGAVDAAVGGKTGINFNGLKNEIGVFSSPLCVFVDADFFRTLPLQELLSGYAEMIKHALLSDRKTVYELLSFSFDEIDYPRLGHYAVDSVKVKQRIVEIDPLEKGVRMALNLGHTIGHAFESLSHRRGVPVPHGYAVVFGLICELYVSHKLLGFPLDLLQHLVLFVKENYSPFRFDCNDYQSLYEFLLHDKKNKQGKTQFALLRDAGDVALNQEVSYDDFCESLDFYRDVLGRL